MLKVYGKEKHIRADARCLGNHNLAAIRSNASFSTSAPVRVGYVHMSKFDLSAAS